MLLLLLALHLTNATPIEWMRQHTFDLYQQFQPREPNPEKQAAQVRIIDIDERALREVGQWPWPRTKLAQLVDKLHANGVLVTGFDMVFAEQDRTSPHKIAEDTPNLPEAVLQAIQSIPKNEVTFAEAIKKARVVLGQVGLFKLAFKPPPNEKVGFGIVSADADSFVKPMLNRYEDRVKNLSILEDAADGVGLFSTRSGSGGVIRRVALVEKIDGVLYPSLSLEMLRVALGGKDDYLIKGYKDGTAGVESIVVKGGAPGMQFEIPTDSHGRVYVHFAKYPTAKPPFYISAAEVLNPKEPAKLKQLLAGSLAILGTSAVGLKDIRKTPISPVLPGVEVHAQLLETILSDSHLTRPDEVVMIEWLILLISGLLMIFLIPKLSAALTFLFTTTVIGSSIAAGWYFYTAKNQLLDASYPALSLFALFMVLGYLNYAREEKQRKQVKHAFGHYVSPALLEELADNPDRLSLGGETRNITVFFSDIRGFTTISEKFNAQELTQFINRFLTPMTNVILQRNGTVDKYMGDAIMAFWNAPVDVADHAHQACYAALEMQEAVKGLNATLQTQAKEKGEEYTPIAVGVGLNTDDCCVGNMGSDQRFDYSALGDGVNLGSRLEGQSKTYGVDIIIGENTAAAVADDFALLELDLLQVKGKTKPVRIFALMGDKAVMESSEFVDVKQSWDACLGAYRAKQWENAKDIANKLHKSDKSLQILCELLISRINAYEQQPPPEGWDGVAIATSK